MPKLIVANWKSNPSTLPEALKLARASDFKNVVIAPPYVHLAEVGKLIKNASLGAQNVFWEDGGPYTGEVSASQLKKLKVKYVIIGHSERRKHLGETDKMINKKIRLALGRGLKVILCVGEDLKTRRQGTLMSQRYVANQLKKDLAGIHASRFAIRNLLIIAYEPVWAISTGKGGRADTPQNAVEMMTYIEDFLATYYKLPATKTLYGGSVTPRNVKSFLSQPEIDGALVGGASLNPKSFKAIINIT